jgi:SSS family solute:Na+ symporter
MQFEVSFIDGSIVIAYLIFVILLGFYFSKKHENAEDYFLAGRSLTWPVIGFSLFASNMSSNSLMGLAGAGFADGFSVYSYEWMAVLVLIIFAIFFLPFYLKNKIFTIPEFLEKRFDYATRAYASSIAIVLNVIVDIAATLFAGGIAMQLLFPEIPLWLIIAVISFVAGIYTIAGGLKAVVYTDTIQAIILIIGSIIITVVAWNESGGMTEVMKVVDAGHTDIIKPISDKALPWPGLLGVFILGFYFWGTNQYITQRSLAAKSKREGQWGAMFAGILKVSIIFIMIFPGAFARVLYPDIAPNEVYPTLLFDLLPTGILGLVLAGFIAALMSSVDSGLNSVSTLFTMDFYQKWYPKTNTKHLMKVGRIVTLVVMVLSALWAPMIVNFEKLWDYLQQSLAWFCPPIVALFVMGILWKRANATGAKWTMAIGGILTIISILFSTIWKEADFRPHFLYFATVHFLVSCMAMYLGSMSAPAPSEEKLNNTIWTRAEYDEETVELQSLAWYKNYRYQGLALIVLTAIILFIY